MTNSLPLVTNTISDLRAAVDSVCGGRGGAPVVLVPTMGALHEGHLSLVKRAQRVEGAVVVVSIFVNPLQFGEGEDLDAYPRTLDADVDKLAQVGADIVFAPSAREMYPHGPRTVIHPGEAGSILEGASRPTHFAGVLTVVNKLFGIVGCTHAVFGEKDYQQLLLIRQMVEDLNMPVDIIGAPIVREDNGLAKSSRNAYLSDDERALATALNRALHEAQGENTAEEAIAAAEDTLAEHPEIAVDYVAVRSPDLGEPVPGMNRILLAARVGNARLIDNMAIELR